jgi:hypothetical protein
MSRLPLSLKSLCVSTLLASTVLAQQPSPFANAPAGTAPAATPALSAEAVRSKQDAQKRSQVIARELVGSILDIQIKQLEQNGLQNLEIYKEIVAMRQNIDGLIAKEMQGVVELLTQAQTGPAADRTKNFNAAREKIRSIVTELAIQRQNLAKRLKVAEIAAQIKRLIDLESNVLASTTKAQASTEAERLQAQVVIIEDQRDVVQLYDTLDQLLVTVSKWSGVIGAGATDAHKYLRAGKIPQELQSSITSLTISELMAARENEQNVIRTLKQVLDKIQETQGLIGTDREAMLQFVREMIAKQENVLKETKKADLTNAEQRDKAQAQEADIRKQLGQLADSLREVPAAVPFLEQAQEAAKTAETELFYSKKEPAAEQQNKVLGNLAEIEQQLRESLDADRTDRSAEELAKRIESLEKAKGRRRRSSQGTTSGTA